MRFIDVIGQQRAKKGTLDMVAQGRLPHALLLNGPPGAGVLPFALALATRLFCQQPLPTDACGECPSCIKMKTLEHPDLLLAYPTISPKPNTKAHSAHFSAAFREFIKHTPYAEGYDWLQFINAENKQGNITAEECRELVEKLYLKSYEGGNKVLVIWLPEYLGKEGNILLKAIEEPPANTFIILAALQLDEILPTIVSRSQIIRLAPLSTQEIEAALIERWQAAPRQAAQSAQLANGDFHAAVQLLQQQEEEFFPDIRDWFNHLFTGNGKGLSEFAEQQAKNGREQQRNFLFLVEKLLQHALKATMAPALPTLLPEGESVFVRKLAALNLSLSQWQNMIHEINKTAYHIERNAHAKSQLHALSIRLQYIIKQKTIHEEIA